VVLDERSAGFTALGLARATGKPAAVVCTSGSAAANYLPAVVEADRGRVPLVVVTADRPPGFLDRDAPQTINQIGLYGSAVRASAYFPVAHECDPERVAAEVLRVLGDAYPPNAGPVHLNVPFDKPLEPPGAARRRTVVGSVAPGVPGRAGARVVLGDAGGFHGPGRQRRDGCGSPERPAGPSGTPSSGWRSDPDGRSWPTACRDFEAVTVRTW